MTVLIQDDIPSLFVAPCIMYRGTGTVSNYLLNESRITPVRHASLFPWLRIESQHLQTHDAVKEVQSRTGNSSADQVIEM
jgi:hypothetical protein